MFLTKSFVNVFMIILGVLVVIGGVFLNKGYHNRTFYIATFGMMIIWGLSLTYVFLSNLYLEDKYSFILLIGLFIFIIIYLIRDFNRRLNNPKMPWKEN